MTARTIKKALLTAGFMLAATQASPQDTDPRMGRGSAMVTDLLTCYVDNATLYGPYALDGRGYSRFRFQLREDGLLVVNGYEVKPVQVNIDGATSTATTDVGSISIQPEEARMMQRLSADHLRQFQEMAIGRGMTLTGGLVRFATVSFSESTLLLRSLKDDREADVNVVTCNR